MTGVPKNLAVFAAVLLALLLVVGGAAPAVAHGPHHATGERHQIDHRSEPAEMSRAAPRQGVQAQAASKHDISHEVPEKSGSADCCCGSLMCHAGVTLIVELVPLRDPKGEKVVSEPASSRQQQKPSGLERPPRA